MKKRKNEKHGMSGTSMYKSWRAMRQRCSNPNTAYYENYGGKGVKVCREWDESFIAFRDWSQANGHEEGLTIDRIDSEKDYEPGNCQWLTQSENTKRSHQNPSRNYDRIGNLITFNGISDSVRGWSETVGVDYMTLYMRLQAGWTVRETLTTKVGSVDNSNYLEFEGISKTLTEWASDKGMKVETLRQRVMDLGWSTERALTTPVRKRGKNKKRVDK